MFTTRKSHLLRDWSRISLAARPCNPGGHNKGFALRPNCQLKLIRLFLVGTHTNQGFPVFLPAKFKRLKGAPGTENPASEQVSGTALIVNDVQSGLFPICDQENVISNINALVNQPDRESVPVISIPYSDDGNFAEVSAGWLPGVIKNIRAVQQNRSIHHTPAKLLYCV